MKQRSSTQPPWWANELDNKQKNYTALRTHRDNNMGISLFRHLRSIFKKTFLRKKKSIMGNRKIDLLKQERTLNLKNTNRRPQGLPKQITDEQWVTHFVELLTWTLYVHKIDQYQNRKY